MSDWSKPTLTSTYANFLTEMSNRVDDAAKHNRSDTVTLTSPPVGLIRWNKTSKRWEDNTGTVATPVWSPLASTYAINVATANELATARTASLTGDATGTSASWTGAVNLSIPVTLATVNASPGSYGSASAVPVVTVNAKGLVTSVTTVAIGSVATQSASAVAITGGTIRGTNISLKQGTTAAPTAEGYIEWDTDNDTLMLGTGAATLTFAPLAPAGVVTMTNHTFGSGCTWGGNAVPVANGGTGSTTATAARTALGIGSMGAQNSSAISVSGGSMTGVNITLKQGTAAAPTAEGLIEWDTNDDLLVVGDGVGSKMFAPINPSAAVTMTDHTFSTGCVWSGGVIPVQYGGTGVATLSGVAYGNGTGVMTAATATQLRTALGTLPAANGGTGVATLTGVAYGNGTGAMTAATAAQLVAAIGTTAVTNATNAVNADTLDTYHASSFVRTVNGVAPTSGNVVVSTGVTSVNSNTGAITAEQIAAAATAGYGYTPANPANAATDHAHSDYVSANMTHGAVGSLCFASAVANPSNISVAPGGELAGSSLKAASVVTNSSNATVIEYYNSASLPGTWRCLGYLNISKSGPENGATLWQRIG